MAFTNLTNAQTTWFLTNRHAGLSDGTPGTALVSDLLVGDYVIGARAKIASLGTTTSGVRTLTLDRVGTQFTVGWVAASSAIIIRP